MATRQPYRAPVANVIDMAEFDANIERILASESSSSKPASQSRTTARAAGDVGLALGQGAVGAFKSISDIFGADNAVSSTLGNVNDGLQNLKSDQSKATLANSQRRIQEAEATGDWKNEVAATMQMLWDQPAEMLAQGAGSFATLGIGKLAQAAKLTQAAKAAGVSKAVFLDSPAGREAAKAAAEFAFKANVAVGAGQGVGSVKGSQYEQTLNAAKAQGMGDAEARALASESQAYGGPGTMQQLLGGVLGAGASATGPIERMVAGKAVSSGPVTLMGGLGKGFATEGATEGAQGAQERYAGNDAAIDAGVLDESARWRGVAGQGVQEGVVGGLLGAMPGGIEAMGNKAKAAADAKAQAAAAAQAESDAAAAAIRANKQPGSGPLTNAVNAGTEADAQKVEVAGASAAAAIASATDLADAAPSITSPEGSAEFINPDFQARQQTLAEQMASPENREKVRARFGEDGLSQVLYYAQAAGRADIPAKTADSMLQVAERMMGDVLLQPLGGDAQLGGMVRDPLMLAAPEKPGAQPLGLGLDQTPSGRFTVDAQGNAMPETAVQRGDAQRRAGEISSLGSQKTDILNPSGQPFKTKLAASLAAKKTPGEVVEAPGGYAVRAEQTTPETKEKQAQQPASTPATAMPTDATPESSAQSAILGRNSQPIAEGGQPFATREEAKAEKRMQPLMRVAPAEGGGFILKPASERQLAAVEKAAKRLKYPSTGETGPRSLHGFILQIGGLASGAMPDVGFDLNPRVGNRRLFSPRGKTIEQAAMAAKQEGYIQDEDENTLIEALKRSLNVSPVYTPDGYEAMAEAQMQARYEDFLAAEQDGGAENDWSRLTPEELADTGYNDYDEATQAEIRALVAQAEALGIDAESILEDVAQRTENATQKDYENAAKSAIEAAIRSSEESRSRDLGQASAEAGPATAGTQAAPAAVTGPASDVRARNLAALKARMMGQKKPTPTTPPAPNQQATPAPEAVTTNQGAKNGQKETLLKEEQPTGAAAMVSGAPVADTSLNRDSSWVIREKATGKVVMETFDRAKVDALNTAKYEAVPIQQHLAEQGAKKPSDTTKPGGFIENAKKAAGKVDAAPAQPILTSPTKADIEAKQARAEQAAKAKAAQDKADAARAAKERERKEVAAASVAAADTFELGQDAMANLTGQNDLQFSRAAAKEVRDLVTLHNLSEDNLMYAGKMGGIPVPSIGITKVETPFGGFGEITLIAPKDLIDPEAGVPVYDRDAWTARFPTLNFKKIKAKVADAFYERMSAARDLGSDGGQFMSSLFDELRNAMVQSPDKITSLFTQYSAPKMLYAQEALGKIIKPQMRGIKPETPFGHTKAWRDFVAKSDMRNMTEQREREFNREAAVAARAAMAEIGEARKEGVDERTARMLDSSLKSYLDRYITEDGMNAGILDRALRDVKSFGQKEIDPMKMDEAVRKVVPLDDAGYKKWVAGLVEPLFEAPTITVRGSEVPVTLENVVEAMTIGKTAGAEKSMTFGVGKAASMLGKQFKSIDEIKAARDQVVSSASEKEGKKSTEALISEYQNHVSAFYTGKDWKGNIDTWAALDSSLEALTKAGRTPTDGAMNIALQRSGFKRVDAKGISLAKQALEALRDATTDYFEAKPQRAVRLNEFKGAVVPKGTSAEAIALLEENGITVEVHGNAEGAREKAIQKLAKKLDGKTGSVIFSRDTESPRTPSATIRSAITKAYGNLLDKLEGKGLVTIAQTEREAIEAAAQARADKTGGDAEAIAGRMMSMAGLDVKYSANGNIEGFFDKQTGKSFLVADNLTAASAPGTLMHEVGIHMAADGKLEPLFKRAGSLLKTGTQNEFIQRVKARMARAGETSDEEAAAYIVTEYENDRAKAPITIGKWLADLTAAVRAWLFGNGVILKADQLTVADIAAVSRANARSMARGGPNGGPGGGLMFSRAADMAGNAIDKAKQTADKAMGKDFPRAASMPDLNDDQRSLLGKVGASQSPASDAIKAATDRAGLKIRQGMVDRFAALKELDEKALGQNFIADSITNSAWVLAKMSSAGSGALNAMMKSGRIEMDAQQKVIGLKGEPNGGLTASLQKLGGPAEVERFFAWVAANRAEKLMGEGRENLFTPAEIAAGKTLNTGTTEGGKVRPALYSQVFAEFQQYRDDVLAIAEQTGIINSENRAMWRDEFYVPFYRVMEDDADRGRSGGNGLSRQEAYKKLKGGKQNLNDLMENTLMNFHHLLSASLKNQAAVQAIKNAEHVGIARKVPEARRDTKTSTFVLVDGKKVFYEVDDPLVFESITTLADPGLNNTAVRVMGAFKRLFTNMTTATPQFIIANTFRDLLQASATSPTSKNIAKNLKEGIQSYRDEKTRAEMLASGGAFSFGHIYGMGADEVKASLQKTVAGAGLISSPSIIPSILRKVWDAWSDVTDLSENASRAATYTQNVDQMGKLRAAFEARDVMDFSQHGAWPAVRLLVRIVPFLNARLQGLDKLYRSGVKPSILTAMGKGTDTDKQAAARFAMVTGALTLATMALYLVNADDDEYKKLEEWQKDTYWFIRIGENAFFLPKPFEVGALATMAERTLQQAMDDKATGKLFRERMWEMLMQTFAFNPTPQMFQPLIDVYANKDAFTGRDIESAGMERMSTGLRSRDTTTAPATALSAISRVFGDESAIAVSPVQADHLIKGYLGGVGATAAGLIDTMYRAATGQSSPDKAWSEYQPIRRFYRDLDVPVANTRYTTLFYDGLKEAGRVYADVMELQKLGRTEEAQALATEKRSVLQMRIALNAQQRRLTEINNRMKEVRRSDKDGEWKRRELDLLTTQKALITERLGKRIEDARAQ